LAKLRQALSKKETPTYHNLSLCSDGISKSEKQKLTISQIT
jgi:hypothetical protein